MKGLTEETLQETLKKLCKLIYFECKFNANML